MVPATWVPCPTLSDTVGLVLWLAPTTTLPARSGCVVSTPVSRTATTTDGLPWVTSHPERAPTCAGAHWTVPTHDDRHGSSGQSATWYVGRSTPAPITPGRARRRSRAPARPAAGTWRTSQVPSP